MKQIPYPHTDRATEAVEAELCDRCGARAKVLVILPDGHELAFCGHHGNRYAGSLLAAEARIVTAGDFVLSAHPA